MKLPTVTTTVTGVLALTLVLLVAANVLVRLRNDQHEEGQAARVVAQHAATGFFSLSHEDPGGDVDAVLAMSTGSFKKEYAAKRSQIVDSVTKNKLTVKAQVPADGAALEYLSETAAQVLVAVDVSSKSAKESSDAQYRTRVKLKKRDDTWLVSGLEQVG
ncbi:hypothetical protein ABTX24_26230 [Nocardioides sp. NPDC127514]|uniref:hypothetical protein n=1 Tax=unclassified Nocardioides TaxID=2615069 RepID=UPI00331B7A3B